MVSEELFLLGLRVVIFFEGWVDCKIDLGVVTFERTVW